MIIIYIIIITSHLLSTSGTPVCVLSSTSTDMFTRLTTYSALASTLTLSAPHRPNPNLIIYDYYLHYYSLLSYRPAPRGATWLPITTRAIITCRTFSQPAWPQRARQNRQRRLHIREHLRHARAICTLLDAHGWRIDRPCIQVCTPLAGPLKFTREAIDDCVRRCGARATVDHTIASRTADIPPRGIISWCHVDGRSARHVDGDGYDLLTRMLELDPRRRIDATSALNHPYLTRARAAASHVLTSLGHASPRSAARPATLSARTVTLQSKSATSRVRALRTNAPASATHPPGVHVAPGASPRVYVAPHAPADASVARVHVGYVLLGNPFSHGTTGRGQVHLPN